jgi:hypothetical protein
MVPSRERASAQEEQIYWYVKPKLWRGASACEYADSLRSFHMTAHQLREANPSQYIYLVWMMDDDRLAYNIGERETLSAEGAAPSPVKSAVFRAEK